MSQEKPIHWKKLSNKTAYRDRIHIVRHDVELPNGDQITYDVDHSDGFAAATLIKTPENEIILTHQYRFPIDRWIYDLPAGGGAADEDIEAAAIRECQEEVGLAPTKLTKLAKFYVNPGRSNWPVHVFYCEDYEVSPIHLNDPAEDIDQVRMPIAEFQKLVDDQEIVDPALLIAWHSTCARGLITP